jgi:hypothetical protein
MAGNRVTGTHRPTFPVEARSLGLIYLDWIDAGYSGEPTKTAGDHFEGMYRSDSPASRTSETCSTRTMGLSDGRPGVTRCIQCDLNNTLVMSTCTPLLTLRPPRSCSRPLPTVPTITRLRDGRTFPCAFVLTRLHRCGNYGIQLPGNLIPRGFPRIPVPNDLRGEVPMNETRPLEHPLAIALPIQTPDDCVVHPLSLADINHIRPFEEVHRELFQGSDHVWPIQFALQTDKQKAERLRGRGRGRDCVPTIGEIVVGGRKTEQAS